MQPRPDCRHGFGAYLDRVAERRSRHHGNRGGPRTDGMTWFCLDVLEQERIAFLRHCRAAADQTVGKLDEAELCRAP